MSKVTKDKIQIFDLLAEMLAERFSFDELEVLQSFSASDFVEAVEIAQSAILDSYEQDDITVYKSFSNY